MKIVLTALLCCLIGTENFAQSQKSTNPKELYLGVRYKDYHELRDLKKLNSTVINLHYGVAHLRKGEKNLLFLSKFENSNRHNDDFQLRVIDVVEIPNYNEVYYTILVKGCSLNGKNDATIFALTIKEEGKYLKAAKTWKLDKPTGKISEFPSIGIKCINPKFRDEMVVEELELSNN